MKQAFRITLGVFLLLWAVVSQAEVRIEITQGVNTARPIGVVPFQWTGTGPAPADIGGIIAADLRNSGKFNPLDRSRLPQEPTTAQQVQPAAWSALGIDAVVVGQIQANADGSYQISYQLVDTAGSPGTVMSQNSYKVTKQWLRYAAHTASDEVFQKLTGIKGAFRTRIAYVVETNGGQFPYELRVSDYDGYNQFVVHRSPEPLMSPAWSADGNELAYVTFETGRSALVVQNLSNSTIRTIADFPRHNGAPAFSPDGKKLAFVLSKTGSLNLYVMDLASGQIRQLTNARYNSTEPTWFPDSETLAYTSDQAGRPQIYKMNINGGTPQRITWQGGQNQDADVSPDGKFMVMVSTASGAQHITKQDLETGAVQQLTDTYLDETPSLAPNGTMVIYGSTEGYNSVLQLVSTDGRFKARLPATDGQVSSPAWSPYM
ncbi:MULTISPECIES: Tol-Pal system beta propeller repeat protein TolB [Tatumella]|uniref:Tol-Pal system protein TolB n=2 Tax=Tatumella ptyseos TaxID=82987 RepID=A0A085JBT8_9GAMM|nr:MULTISPECIES: Tol-Pal system beta propeller repeat protein TolB [Tatumella]KFD17934.1 TolB family component of a TonB-independent translocation system [Tatumella ptyseos ATCC 33301]SQK74013.1 translocation protein TolB [Tatumella ptyseos]